MTVGNRLSIGVPLRSAGLPYSAIPPSLWEAVLDGALGLGFRVIRLDVPWELHEPAPGAFEWGETRPQLAIERVLELAHSRGLFVLVRPGPWVDPPRSQGGIPSWLLREEGVWAVRPNGRPADRPCLVSDRLGAAAGRWFEALFERIAPHVIPRGPVAGCLIGDPIAAPSDWPGGALDASSEARRFLTRYLATKYGDAGPQNSEDGGGSGAGEEIDRVEAGEVARRLPVRWARQGQRTVEGPEIPLMAEVMDVPPGSGGDSLATRELVDGLFLALPGEGPLDYTELRLQGLRAASLAGPSGISGLRGSWPLEALDRELDLATAAAVLAMSGVRALDVRTLVPLPGDGSSETPLGSRGEPRETGLRLLRLFRLLDAIDHASLERRVECQLLGNRELARLREAHTLCGSLPAGLGPPRALRALRSPPLGGAAGHLDFDPEPIFEGLFDGLRRSAVPFGVSDTSLSSEQLASLRTIFVVSSERMSRPLAQRLFEWAEAGGTLVLGPRVPDRDWAGGSFGLRLLPEVKEQLGSVRVGDLVLETAETYVSGTAVIETPDGVLAAAAPMGRGQLVRFGFTLPFGACQRDPDSLGWIVSHLAAAAGLAPSYAASDPAVETELHEGAVRRFLFVANPTGKDRAVTVALGANEAMREVRGTAQYVRPGQLLAVPAQGVLVRELVTI